MLNYISLFFANTYLIFILKSPDYYNVPNDKLGSVIGIVGFYAELSVVFANIIMGIVYDTIGRKIPMFLGFTLLSISVILMPFFT